MKTARRIIPLLTWIAVIALQSALAQAPPNWSSLGAGMNDRVYAIVVSGSNVYAAGKFTTGDGATANRVAKWDGTNWTPLGSGMDGPVLALAVSGTNLYAGGSFTSADGNTLARGVAQWNGSSWSAVGSLFISFPDVRALAVSGSTLYVAGAGSVLASYNGSFWDTTIGNGLNGTVYALAVSGSTLYAGGDFPAPLNCIAKRTGSSWSALGTGMSGTTGNFVDALAVSGSTVYAGGNFTSAGSTSAGAIAKWNGSSWSSLDIGVSRATNLHALVYSLAISGNDLYVGGDFRLAGTNAADRIAKWNGSSWSALGSGVNSNVWALAVSGNDLYVGGDFTTAGGNSASYIAKATIGQALPGRFSDLTCSSSTGFSCTFLDASVGQPYRVEASTSLSSPDWWEFTNFIYAGPIVLTDSSILSGTNRFFRAVTP